MNFFRISVVLLSAFSVAFGVNLLTPIHVNYALRANMGLGVLTLVFSVYILGMFLVLLLLSGLSDVWGRRNVLFVGQILVLFGIILVYCFPTLGSLFVLRFLVGLGVGLTFNTATALLNQMYFKVGKEEVISNWMSSFTTLGFGSGAFLTSLFLFKDKNLVEAPTFLWAMVLCFLCLVGICFLPNYKLLGVRTVIRKPFFPKKSFPFSLTLGMGYSATAVMIAIVPSQLRRMGVFEYNGLVFFIHTLGGVVGSYIAKRVGEREALKWGYWMSPLGVLLVVVGGWYGWMLPLFFGGFCIGASGWGLFYFSVLKVVSVLGGVERARAVAGMMFVAYLGFGVPVIVIGFLSDWMGLGFSLVFFLSFVVVGNGVLYFLTRSLFGVKGQVD